MTVKVEWKNLAKTKSSCDLWSQAEALRGTRNKGCQSKCSRRISGMRRLSSLWRGKSSKIVSFWWPRAITRKRKKLLKPQSRNNICRVKRSQCRWKRGAGSTSRHTMCTMTTMGTVSILIGNRSITTKVANAITLILLMGLQSSKTKMVRKTTRALLISTNVTKIKSRGIARNMPQERNKSIRARRRCPTTHVHKCNTQVSIATVDTTPTSTIHSSHLTITTMSILTSHLIPLATVRGTSLITSRCLTTTTRWSAGPSSKCKAPWLSSLPRWLWSKQICCSKLPRKLAKLNTRQGSNIRSRVVTIIRGLLPEYRSTLLDQALILAIPAVPMMTRIPILCTRRIITKTNVGNKSLFLRCRHSLQRSTALSTACHGLQSSSIVLVPTCSILRIVNRESQSKTWTSAY